jgi:rSAM/selenodomain-associated transferase 1
MNPTRVALLARAPVAGQAKTRLAPLLGGAGAAALAAQLLAHAVAQAVQAQLGEVCVWATPDASHPAFQNAQRDHGVRLATQGTGDIGARMAQVFAASFAQATTPVLLMGSDIPGLTAAVLQQAAAALQSHDAVFVPALDGGYALVGLHAPAPSLFNDMAWSTPQVMTETRVRLAALGLRYLELPALADIDVPADLVHLPADLAATAAALTIGAPTCRAVPLSMSDLPSSPEQPALPTLPSAALPADTPALVDDAPASTSTPAAAVAVSDSDPNATTASTTTATTTEVEAEAENKGPANLSPAAVAALLAQHFPALFGAGRALPIKLRIQADIQTRLPGVFSKKSLSIFLHRYTTSTPYLKALAAATHRVDLDGAAAGEVVEEHRVAAAQEVERRRTLFAERRNAERELAQEARQAANEQARKERHAKDAARHAAHNHAEAEARRQRAGLLRAFETTTLTPANFCALKGLVESDLQAQLTLARQEREQRPPEPPPRHDNRPPRGDNRGPRRGDERGEQRRHTGGGRPGPAPGKPTR